MQSLTPGTVFDPSFQTAAGALAAGSAFALELPKLPVMLVTCQHLFGPAGGLSKDVPPALMARFVDSVVLTDVVNKVPARAGAALPLPDVDATDPMRDLAAFVLEPSPGLHPLHVAGPLADHARVFLASRLRAGATPGEFLHPAEYVGEAANGTMMIKFDDPEIHLPGASGAPVVTESGGLVGMMVRFYSTSTRFIAALLPATVIQACLAASAPAAKPKGGLLQRLFRS